MGLFDFLKSNKNIITDNGTNFIYENDGKGKLKEKFIKVNGVLHGEYLKYDESGKILSTDYYHDGHIITLDEKQRIDDNKRRIENNEKEKTLNEYKNKISKLIEIDKTIFDVAYGNLIVQMTNATLLDFSRELSDLFIDYFEEELIKIYLFYKRNYLIHKLISFKDDEINLNQVFTDYLNSTKKDIDFEISKIGDYRPKMKINSVSPLYDQILGNVFYKLKRTNNNSNLITSLSLDSFNVSDKSNNITNQDCELIGLEIDGYITINNKIKSINKDKWLYQDEKQNRKIEAKIYKDIIFICKWNKFYQEGIEFNLENLNAQNLIKSSGINNLSAVEFYERAKTKYYELKDYSGAIDDFNKSIQKNPNFSEAFFNRGILKKVMEDYQGALEDYNKAIELDENSEAYRFRAGIKITLKDFVGAMNDYNFAIEKHPNQQWMTYYKRGCFKIELEDYKGAILDFDMSIDTNINSNKRWPRSDFYKKRGDCKLKIEDYRGAIEDLKKAIELDPDFEEAIQLLESFKDFHTSGTIKKEDKYKDDKIIRKPIEYFEDGGFKVDSVAENIQLIEIYPKLKGINFNNVIEKVFTPFTLSDDMKGKWFFGASTIFLLYQIYDNDDYEDDLNELLKLNNILYINHETNNSGAVVWEGDGFKIELLKTKNIPYSIVFITNDNIVNVGLTKIINLKHIEGIKLNWIYGIVEVYDYTTLDKEFHTHNVPLYWKDSEDNVETIFITTIDKRIAFSIIDQIIQENGGKDLFKSLQNIENWEYLHEGDIFHIGYLTDNECIRINKPNLNFINISGNEVYYGISNYDKKLRKLIKGLNKILYNAGEGIKNGRLCIDGKNIFSFFDTLDESLELFKKIVINYDSSHDVFVLKNGQLNTLICGEGIEFIHNDFRILLINENVKYKFYITPLDDFFTDDKVI